MHSLDTTPHPTITIRTLAQQVIQSFESLRSKPRWLYRIQSGGTNMVTVTFMRDKKETDVSIELTSSTKRFKNSKKPMALVRLGQRPSHTRQSLIGVCAQIERDNR
jgi:hypothetical protein